MGAHTVHHMSKFVEECDDIVMDEARFFLRSWLVEIAEHGSSWWNNLCVNFCSFKHWEDSSMSIFVVPWIEIKVEGTKILIALFVLNLEASNVWMPDLGIWELGEN